MKPFNRFIALLFVATACSSRPSTETLQLEIEKLLHTQEGEFALAFKDLATGQQVLINEHAMFHAASTMKTPVMIEVFKQASQGKFSLKDSISVKTEFNSMVDSTFSLSPDDDSEHDLYALAGKKTTVDDLVFRMITLSSNLATNILIDLVGATNVTQTMRELGAKDILVLRGVEDGKAFRAGLNNKTSAYDLMLIFEKMAKNETVSPEASEEMIRVLSAQEFNTIIPAKLPKDVKVAHKTGWITGLNHDSGIVFLPDGHKYVLVILSHNVKDEEKAIAAMSEASKKIYDFVIANP
jgi:beta-lactamase class A